MHTDVKVFAKLRVQKRQNEFIQRLVDFLGFLILPRQTNQLENVMIHIGDATFDQGQKFKWL